jgi:hypothetical protein
MLSEIFDLESWRAWFSSLDRSFIFLLTLPFVVALVGLWSAIAEKEEQHDSQAGETAAPPAERRVPERRQRARRREDAGRFSGSRG